MYVSANHADSLSDRFRIMTFQYLRKYSTPTENQSQNWLLTLRQYMAQGVIVEERMKEAVDLKDGYETPPECQHHMY